MSRGAMYQVTKSRRKLELKAVYRLSAHSTGGRGRHEGLRSSVVPSNRGIWVEEQPQYLREAYPVPAQAK